MRLRSAVRHDNSPNKPEPKHTETTPSYDEMEVLTSSNAHLLFAKKIIRKHLSAKKRQPHLQQIQAIGDRIKDTSLRLAVIGEFSSGKSTFINALLRRRLLKAACLATTASATYITDGAAFSVKATFADSKSVRATERNYSRLKKAIKRIKTDIAAAADLQVLLNLLTSDQAVADQVKRLEITLPKTKLKQGLSIIDTPGISAGTPQAQNHASITEAVVGKSADAALILIPSTQPMSESLVLFLQTTAKHFLHRCVFAITKMDDLAEDQRAALVDFVKNKLNEKLGLKDPLVFTAAAITMLPVAKVPTHKRESWAYWKTQFHQSEDVLIGEMLRQRPIIVAEHLVHLLRDLLSSLKNEVSTRQEKLAAEEIGLNKNSVPALEEVLGPLMRRHRERIKIQGDKCKSYARSEKSAFCAKAKRETARLIDSADRDLLDDSSLEPKIEEMADAAAKAFLRKVDSNLADLNTCCLAASADFKRQFEKHYVDLKALDVQIAPPSLGCPALAPIAAGFSSAKIYIQQVNKEDTKRTAWSTAIGTIIGVALLGPVGVLAGPLSGTIAYGSGSDLATCQREIRSRLEEDIEKHMERYAAAVADQIDALVHDATAKLHSCLRQHIQEYGAAVQKRLEAHTEAKEQLNAEIRHTQADGKNLTRRLHDLGVLREKLLHL